MGADPVKVFNHVNRFLLPPRGSRSATPPWLYPEWSARTARSEEVSRLGIRRRCSCRNGIVSELSTEGSFPVGLIPEAEYTSVRLQLEPDDTLVLFSDGVTEAEDPDHELFEVAGLTKVMTDRDPESIEDLQAAILGMEYRDFTRGEHQSDDDLTLLVGCFATTRLLAPLPSGPADLDLRYRCPASSVGVLHRRIC